jgi:hypothetical protein
LSIGDAVESLTWRAIFPELVDKEELPAALALNGIEFNLAGAVVIGPVISDPDVMLDAGGNEVSEAPSVLITGDASAATVKLVRQAR